jgi:uncharacterized PurR-regulated membrane protein YhhQ (DUF165 family)
MIFLYLAIIVTSNVITAMYSPFSLLDGILLIPAGSIFIGATFFLRDLVQIRQGKRTTYIVILGATALSAVISLILGDTAHIAIASAIAFLGSESTDTEIFSKMKKSLAWRVGLSGVVGGIVDSLVFVMLGLSPFGAAMLTWSQVPYAIFGQTLAKVVMQPIGVIGCILLRKRGATT